MSVHPAGVGIHAMPSGGKHGGTDVAMGCEAAGGGGAANGPGAAICASGAAVVRLAAATSAAIDTPKLSSWPASGRALPGPCCPGRVLPCPCSAPCCSLRAGMLDTSARSTASVLEISRSSGGANLCRSTASINVLLNFTFCSIMSAASEGSAARAFRAEIDAALCSTSIRSISIIIALSSCAGAWP
jgi:hypothetical protein